MTRSARSPIKDCSLSHENHGQDARPGSGELWTGGGGGGRDAT
jgi:hypothetical protein